MCKLQVAFLTTFSIFRTASAADAATARGSFRIEYGSGRLMTRKKQRQIEKPRFPPGLLFFLALGCSAGLLPNLHHFGPFWNLVLPNLHHFERPFENGLLSSAGSAFQPPWVCSPSIGKPRESGTGFRVQVGLIVFCICRLAFGRILRFQGTQCWPSSWLVGL